MPADTVTYVLELIGIFAFATSGALLAIRSGFDVVGIVVLAETTALGGGVLRDLIIGATPPAAFRDPLYLVIPLVAASVTFFFHPQVARLGTAVLIFDAGGLGLYTVTGLEIAQDFTVTVSLAGYDPAVIDGWSVALETPFEEAA